MKRHGIEFHPEWEHSPMTYWVYRCADKKRWHEAEVYDPPEMLKAIDRVCMLIHETGVGRN